MVSSAKTLSHNAAVIARELDWLGHVMEQRFHAHSGKAEAQEAVEKLHPPALPAGAAPYADVLRRFGLGPEERLVLILAFAPYVRPEILDPFLIQNQSVQRRFTEFGGLTGQSHGGFLPTGQTAVFLLAGSDTWARLRLHGMFGAEHVFHTQNILSLDHRHAEEPPLAGALRLSPEFVERLTTGADYHPPYSPEFPAQRIATAHDWDDLVLDEAVRRDVEDIVTWIRHGAVLMEDWGLKRRIKPGYRSLFFGPPGTGKTLTAALLGKATGMEVYRTDLSKVVSKYIGETEKNLARLFDHAQHQNWILFFDEADALFGKRTATSSSNDRHANQEIAYLLQRVEDFPGVVILATNLVSNVDEAFTRRFQSMIHFPMPDVEQRLRLWNDNFRDKPYKLGRGVDLEAMARDYELSGGSIVNVLRYACLQAVTRTPPRIETPDLLNGVRRELHKDGKFVNDPSR
ncbi:MAG: ATP-binding protein [Rhizomicrobium sp.]